MDDVRCSIEYYVSNVEECDVDVTTQSPVFLISTVTWPAHFFKTKKKPIIVFQ